MIVVETIHTYIHCQHNQLIQAEGKVFWGLIKIFLLKAQVFSTLCGKKMVSKEQVPNIGSHALIK